MLDADRAGLTNLRLVEANAPEVLQHLLPAASVAELWLFFPDPWHKKKHTKRRLVTPEFAGHRARGSEARRRCCASRPTGRTTPLQMREVLDGAPEFVRAFEGEWAPRFEGRVLTAFERKGARAGRDIRDLAVSPHGRRMSELPQPRGGPPLPDRRRSACRRPPARIVAVLRPLGNRDFRMLFSAVVLSVFGAGMWAVVMVYSVIGAGGGPLDLSVVAAANALGLLVCAIPGGIAADRIPRRLVLRAR